MNRRQCTVRTATENEKMSNKAVNASGYERKFYISFE